MPRSPLATAGTGAAVVGLGVLALAASAPAPADRTVDRTVTAAPATGGARSATPPGAAAAGATSSETPSPASPSPSEPSGVPSASDRVSWIEASTVGIRTPVTPRGLSPDGTISPPRGTVMWFTGYDRVMPGLVGTSVVAGHVAYDDVPDVFHRLPELRPGQEIRVGYDDGDVLVLTVTRTEIVDKNDLQTDADVWGPNSTTRRVVLITCDDAFGRRADGHRVANFVVVAEA